MLPIFKKIIYDNQTKNSIYVAIFSLGLILQSIAILAIFFGIKGAVKPHMYSNVKNYSNCIKSVDLKTVYVHADYLRLPWITPSKNPLVPTHWYRTKNLKTKIKDREIYKLIESGFFNTVIINDDSAALYNLSKYDLLKKCVSFNVLIKKND